MLRLSRVRILYFPRKIFSVVTIIFIKYKLKKIIIKLLIYLSSRIDLILYALIPYVIMFFCSIIIITSIFNSSKNFDKLDKASKKSLRRNKQLFVILITTNSLFICLVSPLVFLNATNNVVENSIPTTVAYIFAYSNHG